jgi:hypothetical protein
MLLVDGIIPLSIQGEDYERRAGDSTAFDLPAHAA